jgi:hypothetical protein
VTTVWRGRRIGLRMAERTTDFNQCAAETWLCVEACDNEAEGGGCLWLDRPLGSKRCFDG